MQTLTNVSEALRGNLLARIGVGLVVILVVVAVMLPNEFWVEFWGYTLLMTYYFGGPLLLGVLAGIVVGWLCYSMSAFLWVGSVASVLAVMFRLMTI